MNIRPTKIQDLPRVMEIYDIARQIMRKNGNDKQWINGFPQEELIKKDIAQGVSFVIIEDDVVHGVFAKIKGADPTYAYIEDGKWPNDNEYVTIHRIASDGLVHGIVKTAVDFCLQNDKTVRIDTHELNAQMQHTVGKIGFKRCGIIYVDDGSPRIAFQLN